MCTIARTPKIPEDLMNCACLSTVCEIWCYVYIGIQLVSCTYMVAVRQSIPIYPYILHETSYGPWDQQPMPKLLTSGESTNVEPPYIHIHMHMHMLHKQEGEVSFLTAT